MTKKTDTLSEGPLRRAYDAAALKCVQGCSELCPFCRDMVDAAVAAFAAPTAIAFTGMLSEAELAEIRRKWETAFNGRNPVPVTVRE